MAGERFVQERMIGVEQAEHGAVGAKQIGEKEKALFVHVAAQGVEGGEMAFALFVERIEAIDVQPGGAELRGQPAHAFILQHAAGL